MGDPSLQWMSGSVTGLLPDCLQSRCQKVQRGWDGPSHRVFDVRARFRGFGIVTPGDFGIWIENQNETKGRTARCISIRRKTGALQVLAATVSLFLLHYSAGRCRSADRHQGCTSPTSVRHDFPNNSASFSAQSVTHHPRCRGRGIRARIRVWQRAASWIGGHSPGCRAGDSVRPKLDVWRIVFEGAALGEPASCRAR